MIAISHVFLIYLLLKNFNRLNLRLKFIMLENCTDSECFIHLILKKKIKKWTKQSHKLDNEYALIEQIRDFCGRCDLPYF